MKKLLISIAGVLAVIIVCTWLYADRVARRAVEEGSTRAFGTPTRVGVVTLGFMDASIALRGYRVRGAGDFEPSSLFSVADARLRVGYGGLGRKRIEAGELTVSGIRLNLLMDPGGTNFGPVLRHLRNLGQGPAGGSDSPRFVIERVRLQDIGVHVSLPGAERELELPPIELAEVGGEDGFRMPQLAALVVGAVLRATARHADLPPALEAALRGGLEDLPGALGRDLRERVEQRLEERTEGLLRRAEEAVGDEDKEGG